MPRDKLNIIIPFYNPRPGWENNFIRFLPEIEKELKETDFTIILVNDGSTIQINQIDGLIERFKYLRYYSIPINMGKGYAVRYGISRSDADFYVYTDVDFPFGYRIIFQAYQMLKSSNINIVIGTRDVSYFRMLPLKRRIISVLLKKLNFLVTGFEICDTQAGLKGLDNKARKVLSDTKVDSFIFELEFLKNSLKQGLSFEMINVDLRPEIRFTNFSFRIIMREAVGFLKIVILN